MKQIIEVQKKLLPDLLSIMQKRYEILRYIRLMQPIGRRSLSGSLGLSERVLRSEVDFLKAQNLIHVSVAGMTLTQEGTVLLKSLEAKGIETAAIDLGDVADPFRQYHKASSGPSSEYRPIFGEVRGADYKDYFGKTIPALCCYAKKGDRAPLEVFPRSDKKLGRVYLIEEWIENYIGELEGRGEAEEAR